MLNTYRIIPIFIVTVPPLVLSHPFMCITTVLLLLFVNVQQIYKAAELIHTGSVDSSPASLGPNLGHSHVLPCYDLKGHRSYRHSDSSVTKHSSPEALQMWHIVGPCMGGYSHNRGTKFSLPVVQPCLGQHLILSSFSDWATMEVLTLVQIERFWCLFSLLDNQWQPHTHNKNKIMPRIKSIISPEGTLHGILRDDHCCVSNTVAFFHGTGLTTCQVYLNYGTLHHFKFVTFRFLQVRQRYHGICLHQDHFMT